MVGLPLAERSPSVDSVSSGAVRLGYGTAEEGAHRPYPIVGSETSVARNSTSARPSLETRRRSIKPDASDVHPLSA